MEWLMAHHPDFWKMVEQSNWQRWAVQLVDGLKLVDGPRRNSDRDDWERTLDWASLIPSEIDLNTDLLRIGTEADLMRAGHSMPDFIAVLQTLHPWRKGPFSAFGVHIDTEWRSDFKWQR